MNALQHCRERVLLGHATGACPDHHTAAKIERAEREMREAISETCGGPGPRLRHRWRRQSPSHNRLEHRRLSQHRRRHFAATRSATAATLPIASFVSARPRSTRALALAFDSLTPPPPDSRCFRSNVVRRRSARSVARYFGDGRRASLFCERRRLCRLRHRPVPRSNARQCRASREGGRRAGHPPRHNCGSSDGICGGDDLIPEWIGFPATLVRPSPFPAVRRARTRSTTRRISLHAYAASPITRCSVLDPLSVPTLGSYPPECGP